MLELLFGAAQETLRSTLAMIGLFFVIPGFIQCFFGYRVLKLYAALMGFLVGLVGFGVAGVATLEAVGPGLLVGLVGGLLLSLLAFKAYKIAVCLINAVNTFLTAVTVSFLASIEPLLRHWNREELVEHLAVGVALGFILAVIAALLTAFLFRPLIIFSSALEGSVLLGGGICMMLYTMDMALFAALTCFVTGAAFQFYNTRGEVPARKKEREEQTRQAKEPCSAAKTFMRFYGMMSAFNLIILLLMYAWYKWGFAGAAGVLILCFFAVRMLCCPKLKRNHPQQTAGVTFLGYMANSFRRYITHSDE